ncbi:MAG: polysaccharide pyruvyl transferase family protein [Planctomycetota bacterium]
MKLAYARVRGGNLGDDLNPWLWPRLLPEGFGADADDDVVLFGIGTILNAARGAAVPARARAVHVFSSGADDVSPLPALDARWTLHCVRGPLTARRFGRPELAVGDGAYLLHHLVPRTEVRAGIGFMPHHRSEEWVDWAAVSERLGWRFISAKGSVDSRLAALNSVERLVTEAMHGAIIADALRVPWTPVRFSPRFGEAKWHDFGGALELSPRIHALPLVFQHRDPWPRLLTHATKRGFRSRTGRGPKKWERLVVTWPVAGERALDELALALGGVERDAPVALSTDAALQRVVGELQVRLERLRQVL